MQWETLKTLSQPVLRLAPHVGVIAVALLSTAASARDILWLKSGATHQGLLVEETDAFVKFDTIMHGARTVATFDKQAVASVIKKELPEGFFGDKKKEEADKAREEAEDKLEKFLVVPLKGEFGTDIYPLGVHDAVQWAKRHYVRVIILEIDSRGGHVWAAKAIADIIARESRDIEFVCTIKDAYSASIWPCFASRRIYAYPGASLGAAVVFSKSATTGAAAVDVKMNSALAAELANAADANGHPGQLARAMIMPEAEVWTWKDEKGVRRFAPGRSDRADAGEAEQIDNAQAVLTLKYSEILGYGIGKEKKGSMADLAAQSIGYRIVDGGDFGASAMKKAKAECEKFVEYVSGIRDDARACIAQLQKRSPNASSYDYDRVSGSLTPASAADWRKRCEESISILKELRGHINRIYQAQKKADDMLMKEALALDADPPELRETNESIDEAISKLRKKSNAKNINDIR